MSLGFKKGSLVNHKKHGLCYVAGNMKGKLDLYEIETNKRIRKVKVKDVKFLAYNSFR